VAYSPDGRRLASAGDDKTVRIWDAEHGHQLVVFRGHESGVTSVAYSPDGRRLASAGDDRTVRIRDVESGHELVVLRGHERGVTSVAYSPDGRRLASAGALEDGTVRIWDVDNGRELLALFRQQFGVWSVAFGPDGRRIACACPSGIVRVWDATPDSPEAVVLREAVRVVSSLLERVSSEYELRDRVARNRTISDPVRAKARELARPFWQSHLLQRSESIVQAFFDSLLLRSRVLEALHRDSSIDPALRPLVLELVQGWPEDPDRLNEASWKIVEQPGADSAAYCDALARAEEACRIEPKESHRYRSYLSTLVAAQYRVGQYEKVLATLTQSNQLYEGTQPAELAFLAMSQHRLGQAEAARATLNRLHKVMKNHPMAPLVEYQTFLYEAETLILGSPAVLPEDVFAP
jgi:hypothetical protein